MSRENGSVNRARSSNEDRRPFYIVSTCVNVSVPKPESRYIANSGIVPFSEVAFRIALMIGWQDSPSDHSQRVKVPGCLSTSAE